MAQALLQVIDTDWQTAAQGKPPLPRPAERKSDNGIVG